MRRRALELLRTAVGSATADFRPGQWEAIERLLRRERLLVVERTGWGKSSVYFLATRLLRDNGAGCTLLISPLLSLMRNQIESARRIGVRAETINSSNMDEWPRVQNALLQNNVDVLLISPERLANEGFMTDCLLPIAARIGLFVVDEAHCISDWGHDFRPDYRRIVRILRALPANVPVLATTATANDRVVADLVEQLGPNLTAVRGPLTRESLMHAIRGAAFIIPGGLGAQEGGLVLLCAIFALPPEQAIALSLVRRAVDVVLGTPSLLAWQVLEWKRLKSYPLPARSARQFELSSKQGKMQG